MNVANPDSAWTANVSMVQKTAHLYPPSEEIQDVALDPIAEKNRSRILFVIFLVLLLITILIGAVRTSRLYYTWQDDVYMGVLADHIKAEGLKPYWQWTGSYARWQGRLYFYFSFIFFVAPYLTNSAFLRTVMITFAQVASVGAMGLFLSLYLTRIGGMLFTVASLCLLPHWLSLYPTTTNMVVYHMPILFYFSGIGLYVLRVRHPHLGRWQSMALLFATLVLVFASLNIYEVLAIPFFLITTAVVWFEFRSRHSKFAWRDAIRAALPFVAIFAIWAMTYVGYRLLHPPTYEGAKLAPFNLGAFAKDVWRHLIKSLPGANAVVLIPWAVERSRGMLYFLKNLTTSEQVQAMLMAGIVCLGLLAYRGREAVTHAWSVTAGRLAVMITIALACAVLAPSPLALTAKYHNWPWEATPYLPDYYAYLAFMTASTAVLIAAYRLRPRAVGLFATATLALCLAFFTAAGGLANDRVNEIQARDSKKWKLVDLLSTTGVARDLPSDAVLLAPTLWVGIEPRWWFAKDYWDHYLQVRLHRPIRVLRSINELGNALPTSTHLYYCEQEWTAGNSASALSLVPIRIDGSHLALTGDSLTIITDHELPGTQLQFLTAGSQTPARVNLPEFAFQGGGFVGRLQTPGLIAGSTMLVPETKPKSGGDLLPIEFERGFSDTEFSGDRYWRWSDGPSGKGILAILDTLGAPVAIKFKARFLTGGISRTCAVEFRGARETLTATDGQAFEREWTLQPGRNELDITCTGPRINAPGDPRFLIFGLEQWSLSPQTKGAADSLPR